MEDTTVTLAIALLEERYLVAYTKLYILADVEVGLSTGLQIKVIPHTVLHTEADVVEGLIGTCPFIVIEQGAFAVTIDGVIAIIVVARRVVEIYTPIYDSRYDTQAELIVQCDTGTEFI